MPDEYQTNFKQLKKKLREERRGKEKKKEI